MISGKVIGRYYDTSGVATPYYDQVTKLIEKAEKAKGQIEEEKKRFPPCNTEWDQDRGARVWCTNAR